MLTLLMMVGFCAVLVGWTGPAGAQEQTCQPEDPYSGGQTCPEPPQCQVEPEVLINGRDMRVRASGFFPGDTLTGVYDGTVVFEEQTVDGTLDFTFRIPDRSPGEYGLVVSGSPSGQQCDPPFRVVAETSVAGQQFVRNASLSGGTDAAVTGAGTGTGGTQVLGRTFARTGVSVVLLVLLGIALVVVGRAIRHRVRST